MPTTQIEPGSSHSPIRAVDRVCDILDALANTPIGVSLSEVAETAELPKSSAFRYLSALEARHYVERDADNGGTYRLGLAFRPPQTRALERLTELARPALAKLRDETDETTNLGILDGAHIVHVVVAESPQMMRLAARVGEKGYVHSTALGKAICAGLPEARVRSILLAAGMPRFAPATVVDPGEFLHELERTRAQGYGLDDAENQQTGRCVAVRIAGAPLPSGISVSAPADRLARDDVPGVADRLHAAARELSRRLRS